MHVQRMKLDDDEDADEEVNLGKGTEKERKTAVVVPLLLLISHLNHCQGELRPLMSEMSGRWDDTEGPEEEEGARVGDVRKDELGGGSVNECKEGSVDLSGGEDKR